MKSASYKESQVSKDIHVSTLTPRGKLGKHYNLFTMDTCGKILIVFSDQPELLEYINSNIGCVFGIKLLKPTNNKYCYNISTLEDDYVGYTIASVTVLVPAPDLGSWRVAKLKNGGVTIKYKERED